MDEAKKFARIVVIAISLYWLIQWVIGVVLGLAAIILIKGRSEFWPFVLSQAAAAAAAIIVIYVLIIRADNIAGRIVDTGEPTNGNVDWLLVAFRLTCLGAGLFFLYWTIPALVLTISAYMQRVLTDRSITGQYHFSPSTYVQHLLLLCLGVYLVYGAPGFVRWQVRKTLEQCKTMDTTP